MSTNFNMHYICAVFKKKFWYEFLIKVNYENKHRFISEQNASLEKNYQKSPISIYFLLVWSLLVYYETW